MEIDKDIKRRLFDPVLRRRLRQNPSEVLDEIGVQFPEEIELVIHTDTEQITHFVLPDSTFNDMNVSEYLHDINVAGAPVGGTVSTATSLGTIATVSSAFGCIGTASSASTIGTVGCAGKKL